MKNNMRNVPNYTQLIEMTFVALQELGGFGKSLEINNMEQVFVKPKIIKLMKSIFQKYSSMFSSSNDKVYSKGMTVIG